jgi:hypothetical protein
MNDKYKNYLRDLGMEIVHQAESAKARPLGASDDYYKGRLFSYYEILDLMRQQAATFGIDASDIGLERVQIEHLLGDIKAAK